MMGQVVANAWGMGGQPASPGTATQRSLCIVLLPLPQTAWVTLVSP